MGQDLRAPVSRPDDPAADASDARTARAPFAPTQTSTSAGLPETHPRKRHPLLATLYALFLVALASFGGGRYWDVIRARLDYADAYLTVIQETRAAFAEAIRNNQKMPRANPALPHVIAVYPPLAARLGQQGDVMLRVLVLPTGQVGDVRVVRSSGYTQLDAAALVGVGSWYYIPAVKDHRPVGTWTLVSVRFRIRGTAI